MWLFFLLLLFLIIIFVPIPIMFEISYVDNIFKAFIYKKLIFSTEKNKEEKSISSKANPKKKKKSKQKNKSKKFDINALLASLYHNPYKPKLKLWLDFEYSLDDAAYTALLYGVLHSALATICSLLNSYINLQIKHLKTNPLFTNTTNFFIKVKGIFYINLAKIIYILFLYFRNTHKNNSLQH